MKFGVPMLWYNSGIFFIFILKHGIFDYINYILHFYQFLDEQLELLVLKLVLLPVTAVIVFK